MFTGGGGGGGRTLVVRLDIIHVKGLSKHTLNTHFPAMKIDPKYVFLRVFFLISHHRFSKIYEYHQKHTLFSVLDVFATMYARTLPGPEKQP